MPPTTSMARSGARSLRRSTSSRSFGSSTRRSCRPADVPSATRRTTRSAATYSRASTGALPPSHAQTRTPSVFALIAYDALLVGASAACAASASRSYPRRRCRPTGARRRAARCAGARAQRPWRGAPCRRRAPRRWRRTRCARKPVHAAMWGLYAMALLATPGGSGSAAWWPRLRWRREGAYIMCGRQPVALSAP